MSSDMFIRSINVCLLLLLELICCDTSMIDERMGIEDRYKSSMST